MLKFLYLVGVVAVVFVILDIAGSFVKKMIASRRDRALYNETEKEFKRMTPGQHAEFSKQVERDSELRVTERLAERNAK